MDNRMSITYAEIIEGYTDLESTSFINNLMEEIQDGKVTPSTTLYINLTDENDLDENGKLWDSEGSTPWKYVPDKTYTITDQYNTFICGYIYERSDNKMNQTIETKTFEREMNVHYKKCDHYIPTKYIISIDNIDEYLKLHEGINDFCPKCQAMNKEYGMYKVIHTGDYDSRSTTLVFNHVDIRKVVRYCYLNDISLHDEDYNINSPYDCTGQCCGVSVRVRKGKSRITLTRSWSYDV